jgi:hypothetical protein
MECAVCGHGPIQVEISADQEVFKFCAWACAHHFASQVVRADQEALGLVEPTLYGLADS